MNQIIWACKFYGIAQQIYKHLLQSFIIKEKIIVECRGRCMTNFDMFVTALWLKHIYYFFNTLLNIFLLETRF